MINHSLPLTSSSSSPLTPHSSRIYIAGHRGLVGSAIVRALKARGYDNLLLATSAELDLRDQTRANALLRAAMLEDVSEKAS